MDIEQMKLILEAMEGAGQGAWWIAVLYLVLQFLATLTVCLTAVTIVWKIVRLAVQNLTIAGALESIVGSLSPGSFLASERRQRLLDVVWENRERIKNRNAQ